jgi:ABC-type Zn uptake system ZnuABC Zn-binding protein ZnuA
MRNRIHGSYLSRCATAILLVGLFAVGGCARDKASDSDLPLVIGTTTIVTDVASRVAGDAVEVRSLLPAGADPHGYDLTPADLRVLSDADVLLFNGLGLEANLLQSLQGAGFDIETVEVSRTLKSRRMNRGDGQDHHDHGHDGHGHQHGNVDPHVWFDPNNILRWVDVIETELVQLDTSRASTFHANASAYRDSLHALDRWIRELVQQVPSHQRVLVSDHRLFGYFAEEYGFEVAGAVQPGFSSMASASARATAELESTIREQGIRTILVGHTVNPMLAERIAKDTGARVVRLYTGSLSKPEGPASTYIEYMRYNVRNMVEGLNATQ